MSWTWETGSLGWESQLSAFLLCDLDQVIPPPLNFSFLDCKIMRVYLPFSVSVPGTGRHLVTGSLLTVITVLRSFWERSPRDLEQAGRTPGRKCLCGAVWDG